MQQIQITIQIEDDDPRLKEKYQEIVEALISTGGLSGMKNGSTNIHFDHDGTFQGIRFDYWPWRRRKKS